MRLIAITLALASVACTPDAESAIDDAARLVANGDHDGADSVIRRIYDPGQLSEPLTARYALIVGRIHDARGEALTEDSLLLRAYDYYRNEGAADADRTMQVTVLTAKYHWWCGRKRQAYEMLEDELESCRRRGDDAAAVSVLITLCTLAERDNDFERLDRCQRLLAKLDADNRDMELLYRYNMALSKYYRNDIDSACVILADLDRRVHTAQDSALYRTYILRSYADIVSDAGRQAEAIALQNRALEYFAGRDSTEESYSHASLARYCLLLGDMSAARDHLRRAEQTATATVRGDLSYAGYYHTLRILADYASTGNFNFRQWAIFVNRLQADAEDRLKITAAKEASNRLLAERNMQQTIARQRMQIVMLSTLFAAAVILAGTVFYVRRKRRSMEEKEAEIETLRRLVSESQHASEQKDDRFFKKIMLQQLGVIRMAAANPTAANQEIIRRMTAIADREVEVDALLDWDDLYKSIDYIYDGFHLKLRQRFGNILNEKEIQLCCLLRANFSTKEISIVTQQSVRTVYQRKTVVRQKLRIEEKGDIADFLSL